MKTTGKRIGLVFDMRFGWSRGEVRGITAYAREHGRPWRFACGPDTPATWSMLRHWRPHGLLVTTGHSRWRGPEPVVGALKPELHGSAILNNTAIGAAAARHFLERGFVNLAFVDESKHSWSTERGQGFEEAWKKNAAARHGASFHRISLMASMEVSRIPDWRPAHSRLATWLAGLPRPVGILACRDLRASEVAQVCHDQGLRVPEDIAIVGVDNDDLLCEISEPPLSSVSVPWEQIGYHMGTHLDRLLSGRPAPQPLPVIEPGLLVVRRSSDVYGMADEAVARACRFISENIGQAIGVEDAAKAAFVSRRGLERRFRRALDRSPLAEIRRTKLDLACRLLRETPFTLAAVAQRTGFTTGERFATVFKAQIGQTPGRYRASFRSLH